MDNNVAGNIPTGDEQSEDNGEGPVIDELMQSPAVQVNNPGQADDEGTISSVQLKGFMETMMRSVNNLQSKIQSENAKLVEGLNSKIENNNKRLSEELRNTLRKEGEIWRAELTNKLAGEVKILRDDISKLRADTATEILSVSNCIDNACESLEGKINGHIGKAEKRLDRVDEEIRAKTKVLEMGLKQQAEATDNELKSLRQELSQDQQQNKVDFNSQLLAEKQARQATLVKMQKEIDGLREKLAMKTTGVLTNNNQIDNGPMMPMVQGDQVVASNTSNENQARSQSEVQTNRSCENGCKCNSTVQDDVNSIRLSDNQNIVHHGSLANCSPLSELTLPIFKDHATQVVGNFLKELDLYFELKGVSENLKLPLASKAIRDPFTKAWLSAEYHKIGTYDQFRKQVTQLLWNDQKQANIRCSIFQDKYDRNGGETLAEHYLRYVNLAANLYPPLSEYDLLGAITAHFPYDVQKCMISANLKSTQDALNLLGKLHAMDGENKTHEKHIREPKARELRRRENRHAGNGREEIRRAYNNVRHITYEQRPVNQRRSTYDRHTTRNPNQSRNDRAEGGPSHGRELNPHVAEFAPSDRSYREEANSESSDRTRRGSPRREN